MWIAVLDLFLADQRASLLQVLDDERVRGPHIFPNQPLRHFPVVHESPRVIQQRVRRRIQFVVVARLGVLDPRPRRGVDATGSVLGRA